MRFNDYLFFTQRLTPEEYASLMMMQNPAAYDAYCADPKKIFGVGLNTITDLQSVRRKPFGDVLRDDGAVLSKLDKNLDALIEEWQKWHVENLEPLCTYSLTTKIGRELFRNQLEKKLVARHVASELVEDADVVCIPEGSSATYVGLAIAVYHKRVTIVTSNEPLLREYRDNTLLSPRFQEMQAIGGHVDDFVVHGGVSGVKCEEQFEGAIKRDPGATVVIMPVTGLLPEDGPYGEDAATRHLKEKLINVSLNENVRALVFITDYTKHFPSMKKKYGQPVFANKQRWQQILRDFRDRISIISVPPPTLRTQMGALGQPLMRQFSNTQPYEIPIVEKEYDNVAKHLARDTRKGTTFECRFTEIYR